MSAERELPDNSLGKLDDRESLGGGPGGGGGKGILTSHCELLSVGLLTAEADADRRDEGGFAEGSKGIHSDDRLDGIPGGRLSCSQQRKRESEAARLLTFEQVIEPSLY